MPDSSIKNFGGSWSNAKLNALAAYLHAYTTALKKTPFRLAYIDAFAGAGIREIESSDPGLFDESYEEEDKNFRHGSPLIALRNDPPFDAFIFIEKDEASLNALKEQIKGISGAENRAIQFLEGDANKVLQELAKRNWRSNRAVVFLDPFALQVDWETIRLLAETKAVDMWLLFPAMAVNRMLPKSGDIPEKWEERLNRLFGSEDWKDAFYLKEQDLFGDEVTSKIQQVFEALSAYVTERLDSVFAGTHKKPLILRNRTGAPIFLLCFAAANPKGAGIAVKIAQHIIDTSTHG